MSYFAFFPSFYIKGWIKLNLGPARNSSKIQKLITMQKAVALFTRKKTSRPFQDFYSNWFNTLKNTLLPLLRRSMSEWSPTLLAIHVEMLHHHFQSYYNALDPAALDDVAQLLFPKWRNSLEIPFLWLGDFHPSLFINILRSFLEDDDSDDDESTCKFSDKPWQIAMAWKNPSKSLMAKIEQIECGLRLMVPALVIRVRDSQAGFIERVAGEWVSCEARKEGGKAILGEIVMAQMEEMVSIFLDANRLRRSVLTEIIGETSIYQAALFLEGIAQFLVGFGEPELLDEFKDAICP